MVNGMRIKTDCQSGNGEQYYGLHETEASKQGRPESHTRHGRTSGEKSCRRQDCLYAKTGLPGMRVDLYFRNRKRQPLRTRQTRRNDRAMSAEVKRQPMNHSAKNAYVRKLVERYGAREIYRSFASKILLPEMAKDLHQSPEVPMEPRKIIISRQVLCELRTGPRVPITLPSQEEALYWLRRWQQR